MLLLTFILACGTVICVSFLCSLSEAVLISLNPLTLKVQHSNGVVAAGRWLALKNHIERPISAILIFNTLANTGLATMAGALFVQLFGADWLWVFSVLLTVVVLFGAEMAPKMLEVHHAERLAPRLIGVVSVMLWICHPVVVVMDGFCQWLKGPQRESPRVSDTIMDIITLVQAAKAEQVLHNREEIIILHAATLSARRVRSSKVPREAVKVFDCRKTLAENVCAVGPRLHRSYPVSPDGSLEKAHGYIRVRELFVRNLTNRESDWSPLVRPLLRVSETASLTQLLALFIENHEIAALVTRKDGQTSGWITMDDVTQVLMGERA